ncbi:uncharacterized protein RCO7_01800 [Rhynchosporium graminicola]|uniref:Uncharacterized protein n=1 Tax=Rhynchosporium graminicola TaxID=2792576 RepID=A0A1E1LSW7_9HELO|nr:uncharacterized protein RCO7_01800 [Rhynchosporium commune]
MEDLVSRKLFQTSHALLFNANNYPAGSHPGDLEMVPSAEFLPHPTSPVTQSYVPSNKCTPATPISASSPSGVAGTAALAENVPPPVYAGQTSQHSRAPRSSNLHLPDLDGEMALTITAATGSPLLSIPSPTFRRKPRPQGIYGGLVIKRNIVDHFNGSGNPFRNEYGHVRQDVTAGEFQTLAEIYGESRIWTFNVEDIYCQTCVEECEANDEAEYRTQVEEFLESSPEVLKAYLILRGRHYPRRCCHRGGIAELMNAISLAHSQRIHNILLTTSSPNTFHSPSVVWSAISMLVECLPNIQHATVRLHSSSLAGPSAIKCQPALLANGVALHLAKALRVLEKHLPEEEGLKIEGLEQQPVLLGMWTEEKKKWWVRSGRWGRKVLRR